MMTKTLVAALISIISLSAYAEDDNADFGSCDNANILSGSMINDVPWDAMYPIRLAGVNISPSGSGKPSSATNKVFCACQDDLGISVPGVTQSMYEPARIVEIGRQPDCFPTLSGAEMGLTNGRMRGSIGSNEQGEGEGAHAAFWHYHYYSYPLLLMLEMVLANRCGDGFMSMDLLYLSELDPTWTDEELSYFSTPESALFANPISLAACIADGAAAAVGKPIDELYWCAGTWGGLYPLSGYVSNKSSIASKTSLLATRSVAAMHRRLLARQTMGDSALCSAPIFPTIPKSQYKMNMMYPVPESGGSRVSKYENEDGTVTEKTVNTGEAHEIGEPAMLWGEWRNIPSKEDAIYMLWRWNDCCTTYY